MYLSDKLRVFIGLPSFVWFLVSNRIGLSQMGSLKCCQYSRHKYEIWALGSNAQSADVLLRLIHPREIVPLNIYFCTKLPEDGGDRVVVPGYQRGGTWYNIVQMWLNLVPKVGVPVPSLYEEI